MDFRISNTGLTRLLDSSLSLSSSSVKSNGTLDPSESWRRIRAAEESREESGRSGDSSSVMELSELKRRVWLSDTDGIVRPLTVGKIQLGTTGDGGTARLPMAGMCASWE